MKQVLILAVGRMKDAGLQQACEDYLRRCSPRFEAQVREVRDARALQRALPRQDPLVVLDERGRQLTSQQFARLLQVWLEQAAARVTFVIGGPDGLDAGIRQRARQVLSLGRMTLAHRLVRLVLAEQLYRAVSILQGAPYHRL